jgi:hypothetical protein
VNPRHHHRLLGQSVLPLQRRCSGVVFTILLRRLALVVIGSGSGGFLAFLPLRGGDPVDDFLVLLDLADSSKVARYRRERMPMDRERTAQPSGALPASLGIQLSPPIQESSKCVNPNTLTPLIRPLE